MRNVRTAYKILVTEPEGKTLLGRSRLDGRTTIKLILKGIGCEA
jgi:hypothetical protein